MGQPAVAIRSLFEVMTGPLFWLVAGILLSIAVSFLARLAYRKYDEPDLRVTRSAVIPFDDEGVQLCVVEVQNVGNSAARNCSPTVGIDDVGSDLLRRPGDAESRPLLLEPVDDRVAGPSCWLSPGIDAVRTINRGDSAWACICRRSERERSPFEIPSEAGWDVPLAMVIGSRDAVEVEVQITAERTRSDRRLVRVERIGTDLEAEVVS